MARKKQRSDNSNKNLTKTQLELIHQLEIQYEEELEMRKRMLEKQLQEQAYELDRLYNNEILEYIQETDKTKTVIIKKMAEESNTSIETLAEYLDCKPQSLRNKMFRDSFSIDDLLIVAHACKFSVILRNNRTNEESEIDLVGFFKPMMDDVLVRISELDNREKKEKRDEYEELKARLEKMKSEYGFEDD